MGPNEDTVKTPALMLLDDGFARVQESIESLLKNATEPMLGFRASKTANSIGWLIWHLSRVQDDHFADLARSLEPGSTIEQCWITNDWVSRFDLPYDVRDTGYGHSSQEVAAFGTSGAELLLGYHADVHEQARKILGGLKDNDLSTVVDTRWDPAVTAASRLVSILGETTSHVGQAQFVHGIFEDRQS